MTSRARIAVSLGLALATCALAAFAPRAARSGETAYMRVVSVERAASLQIADATGAPSRAVSGDWVVIAMEVNSTDPDSALFGDVVLTGSSLPAPLDVAAVTIDRTPRTRSNFLANIANRGGGWFSESGEGHWVTSRTGRARFEVSGRLTFGVAFDIRGAPGPFTLSFGSFRTGIEIPDQIAVQ